MQTEEVSAESIELDRLSDQIEVWRRTRPRTRPMPEGLWGEATAMARRLGIYRVSRSLRLNYDTLKRRAGQGRSHRTRTRGVDREEMAAPARTDFVEVKGLAEMSRTASGDEMVVEVAARDGTRLTIRLRAATTDVNVCERALKKAILHRKNALFYKTLHGARVGDIFMSLIHTAELNDVAPFEYLVALQCHAPRISESPGDWMPWNYRATLARHGCGPDPPM